MYCPVNWKSIRLHFFYIFKFSPLLSSPSGTESVEYKGNSWHDECFTCFNCKRPIGSQSFLSKGNDLYCSPCYDKKFAKHCVGCKKVWISLVFHWKNLDVLSLISKIIWHILITYFLLPWLSIRLRRSAQEAWTTRTSRGTATALFAASAPRLWPEKVSPNTRTRSSVSTATRAPWPRNAAAAITRSQVNFRVQLAQQWHRSVKLIWHTVTYDPMLVQDPGVGNLWREVLFKQWHFFA